MAFDILRKKKAAEILLVLLKGQKGVREIQEAVGGSFTTVTQRIREFRKAHLIREEYLTGTEFGEIPRNKLLLGLTEDGRKLTQSLVESGFLRIPLLRKDRDKWIILILGLLHGIKGKTRFMKLLFLWRFDLGHRTGNFFKFKPYNFGPYSEDVEQDLKELQDDNLVHQESVPYNEGDHGEDRFEYSLTPEGDKISQELLKDLSSDERETLEKLKTFDEMSLDQLLEYVYRKYPRFITGSTIKERVLGK